MPANCVSLPLEPVHVLDGPSYVITLGRNKYRYEVTSQLLREAGFTDVIPFEAVDAIQAVEGESEYDRRWSSLAKSAYGLDIDNCHLQPGQLGCFLSMISVWSVIASSTGPGAMVFEDDALPRPDFQQIFPDYWNNLSFEGHIDMVYVGAQHHPNHIKNNMSLSGYYTRKPTHCLHAHYMTKVGAQKILKFLPTLFDWWAYKYKPGEHVPNGEADGFMLAIEGGDYHREFYNEDLDHFRDSIPSLNCVAFYGKKIPVNGEFTYEPWPERDTGIIHQNASLGSNINGMDIHWDEGVVNKIDK